MKSIHNHILSTSLNQDLFFFLDKRMLVYVRDRVKAINDRLHPRFSLIGFCPSQHHNNELFHLLILVENCYSLSFSLSECQLWGNFGTPQFISASYIGYIKGTPNDRNKHGYVQGEKGARSSFPFQFIIDLADFPCFAAKSNPWSHPTPKYPKTTDSNLQENTRKITNII